MSYPVGSLIRARNREWVVLPESNDNYIMVRPLVGTKDEVTAIHLGLEDVQSAQFELPDAEEIGDHRSCQWLRDAVTLSSRSTAGAFRSLSRIAVMPRPYQIVPLLMALKLDPIRLCIADDVGIGKTIEACLIFRELFDRGEIQRLAVLCPPHLVDQWQKELADKFHITAETVLPSTANKLEKNCRIGQSLFDIYPHVIVSMDFIKSDRRRDEFVRTCPEMVIVDEAHTCTYGYEGRGNKHQRHQLIKQLAENNNRHMILVTATPHSGKEENFRSLLSFLNKDFEFLPQELMGKENEVHRRNLAQYFVQRRRKDIEHFLSDTLFPTREEAEENYELSPKYKKLFDRALNYAKETVQLSGEYYKQRVRWWSVLALLRALSSSPAAAAATLRERAKFAEIDDAKEIEEIGKISVFDIESDDNIEGVDIVPGSDHSDIENDQKIKYKNKSILLSMARDAEQIKNNINDDIKLKKAIELTKKILDDQYSPIIYCRFIQTAEYLAEKLRSELGKTIKDIQVADITGLLPPEERKKRIEELGKASKRVLVCTDCLSEGINLQEHFNAVFHYDLSWSPTRHEQREGRVDRFGQSSQKVRVLTYYSIDNQIDGIVLDVLIRKHKKIRNSLGISVPVPVDVNAVTEAIFEGLLLRKQSSKQNQQLLFEFMEPQKRQLDIEWDKVADREKRSRTMFAQDALQRTVNEEVTKIIEKMNITTGTNNDVKRFTIDVLKALGGFITQDGNRYVLNLKELPRSLKDMLMMKESIKVKFDLPVKDDEYYLNRTHPIVEKIATFLLDCALDPKMDSIAKRSGVIRTDAVERRTTLLLNRFRYNLITQTNNKQKIDLVEECVLLAFEGSPENVQWVPDTNIEKLLNAKPRANINYDQARTFIQKVLDKIEQLRPYMNNIAESKAQQLLEEHQRVRIAAKEKNVSYKIKPNLPIDILGVYVFLPYSS